LIPGLLGVLHVLAVFGLMTGIFGRGTCYREARRAPDLATLQSRMEMGTIFETTLVRPATFAVLLTGLLAAWLRGWPILGFLQGATVNWVS